ncbi:MAG: cobyrinate a,c-diamide synthase [Calditrichaeota bacterium]|nr:cobyrinate a,c-diamide synthase [Calditrichota bacterium]
MIAGVGGDSGKTLATLGLIGAYRRKGIPVMPFKKGPDYIDPAWLRLAAGKEARNLDTYLMGNQQVLRSFSQFAISDGINIMEANRGLHDGENAQGTHSSAEMAKLLKCPVVIVIPVIKVTRTIAAILMGIKMFDPEVDFAGVILNQIATKRQGRVIRDAVENEAGITVLGSLPRMKNDPLPGRHLGLVTPEESKIADKAIELSARLIEDNVDLDEISRIAGNVPDIQIYSSSLADRVVKVSNPDRPIRIGYFTGSAFTFYYPENLEALSKDGFSIIPVNPFEITELPDIEALYIGGGFPETHAAKLSSNRSVLKSVAEAAEKGLPIYAECGGLMFLSKSLIWEGKTYPMAGVFDQTILISKRPQGHGYQEVIVDSENPFFEMGQHLRGHEFHYSKIETDVNISTVFEVKRGVGVGGARDGLIHRNVLASYLHLHVSGAPAWADGMKKAARRYSELQF